MAKSIDVQRVSKKYGDLTVVDNVSFSVNQGELFGFVGPNGAGKTTTINMLCTLTKPTGGRALVNGYDVVRDTNEIRRSIGLVFQETTLDSYLTAEQNLLFHAYAYGVPKGILQTRMKNLMQLVDLWDRRKAKIHTFSGGMKRRLELVRGLIHHPKVLFLDEPTLGLDPQTRNYIWGYLDKIRIEENITVFMTTHYMEEADTCDRIAVIDHGKIVAIDAPETLKNELGGDVVFLRTTDKSGAIRELSERWSVDVEIEEDLITFDVPNGENFLPTFIKEFNGQILSIGVRRPTLDDVFLNLTGKDIRDEEVDTVAQFKQSLRHRRR